MHNAWNPIPEFNEEAQFLTTLMLKNEIKKKNLFKKISKEKKIKRMMIKLVGKKLMEDKIKKNICKTIANKKNMRDEKIKGGWN